MPPPEDKDYNLFNDVKRSGLNFSAPQAIHPFSGTEAIFSASIPYQLDLPDNNHRFYIFPEIGKDALDIFLLMPYPQVFP